MHLHPGPRRGHAFLPQRHVARELVAVGHEAPPALGRRASFEVFPFVDGSRRIVGSNYGSADPAVDFPRYAEWTLDGRLPVHRLIDRRIGLDDLEDAFEALRHGTYARQVIDRF